MIDTEIEELYRLRFLPTRLTIADLQDLAGSFKSTGERLAAVGTTAVLCDFIYMFAQSELGRRRVNVDCEIPQEVGQLIVGTAAWSDEELSDALLMIASLIKTPFKPEIQKFIIALHEKILREAAIRLLREPHQPESRATL